MEISIVVTVCPSAKMSLEFFAKETPLPLLGISIVRRMEWNLI